MGFSLKAYFAILKEWEVTYEKGETSRALRYDPTEARLCCVRCGKLKSKMSRHHTGNDFFFARMMPHLYARRYIAFRKEDTAKLCDDCHKNIHKYYKPIQQRVWKELHDGGQVIVTKEWCDAWMVEFRNAFDKWLSSPVRKRRKKKRRFTT